jgi:ribosomal protein S12 methylthiotransferase accessory factor
MIFIPYLYDSIAGELPITQPISTGLACHMSYARAATSSICEVVERDAFTIVWQACMQMPVLRIESLDEVNRDLVQRLERDGSRVTLVNITLDHGIPTILAVLRSWSQESPALVFGASTNLDPLQAVRKSLEEIAHTRRLAQRLKKELSPVIPGPNYNGIGDQDSHLRFYCDQDNAQLAEFMIASQKQTDLSEIESLVTGDPENDLEILVKKISEINHKALIADITSPDVRELGFHVVRAVIPGFHPLFMGHGIRPLGGKRLWNVPQKLGYQGINAGTGDNPYPHPYPCDKEKQDYHD